ncbi:MAG TPA: ArgR family transcriptional regulator [Candidatus Dormibacteraeota bacterium]|nr:ArgR family transcriptional regulator [Candidatus Dormibacteraeota bacterium]
MPDQKSFRQGQILKLITAEPVANQEQLRRHLAELGLAVTQATLSRDLRELGLVKTAQGYKTLGSTGQATSRPNLARVLRENLRDVLPAQNLLVLKTPPGGAQSLAAAFDRERWPEVLGTIGGDDTVLVITDSPGSSRAVKERIEAFLA